MSEHPWPEDSPGMPAQVGTRFDELVKNSLCRHYGWPLIEEPEEFSDEVNTLAEKAYRVYKYGGAYQDLIREGIARLTLDRKFDLDGVPIYGRPDGQLSSGAILDWKVRGAGSSASPTPGYCDLYTASQKTGKKHPRLNEPLENLNPKWADQLATYSWGEQGVLRPFSPVSIAIDEIVFDKDNNVRVAKLRTFITPEYQEQLYQRYQKTWANISNGEVPPAEPGPLCCKSWGSWCAVRQYCNSYQRVAYPTDPRLKPQEWTINDPDRPRPT